ncbi:MULTISPECIES: calcium-binding protein [unclassified Pseudomonas]|uniref:calcium-binding protein n=1 Tax=unclassified Pseudomonas TaxID=196821 RepID=UPI000A1F080E|nr:MULTISPECIES: calcium-binding protein [unclassified Pseudomonas]
MAVINGTSDADFMGGTQDNDELYGLESDDRLWASAGSDLLDGGEGFDAADYGLMQAGVSVDLRETLATVTKADGSVDTLVNIEKVIGSSNNDTLASSVAGVTLEGAGGDDIYIIDSEGVTIIEEERGGYDELRTSVNTMKLDPFLEKLTFTGTGDFKGYGNAQMNVIVGGAGNDVLCGGDGGDQFVGGEGFDTVSYTDSPEGLSIELSSIWGATGFAFGDTYSSIEGVQGSNFNDVIFAGESAMVMDGADGFDAADYSRSNDAVTFEFHDGKAFGTGGYAEGDTLVNVEKIVGSDLADRFTANSAGITFEGGRGGDIYTVNSIGVSIIEGETDGFDELYTNLSLMKMDPFIEKMTYTGTADFTGYGNDGANIIVGGVGNDVFYGGLGQDVFDGGEGMDTVSYEDSDVGVAVGMWQLGQNGTAQGDMYLNIEALRGSHFDDVMTGSMGDDIFEGSDGNDTLNGDYGNDYLYGGLKSGLDSDVAQADILNGGAGDDVIVGAKNDLGTLAYGGDGNDTITVGSGSAFGEEGFDLLTGTGSHYLLSGGGGNDVLVLNLAGQSNSGGVAMGGSGDDTYIVNTTGLVTIQDQPGWEINDTLILNTIANISQLNVTRVGDDAYLHSVNDGSAGVPDSGVKLQGWYAGNDNIEILQTADGQSYDLRATVDGFALFG